MSLGGTIASGQCSSLSGSRGGGPRRGWPTTEKTPARRRVMLAGSAWRAACGSILTQPDGSYTVAAAAPWTTEPGCRGPCSRRLEGAPRDVPEFFLAARSTARWLRAHRSHLHRPVTSVTGPGPQPAAALHHHIDPRLRSPVFGRCRQPRCTIASTRAFGTGPGPLPAAALHHQIDP